MTVYKIKRLTRSAQIRSMLDQIVAEFPVQECDVCEGSGERECPECGHMDECPECGGSGEDD